MSALMHSYRTTIAIPEIARRGRRLAGTAAMSLSQRLEMALTGRGPSAHHPFVRREVELSEEGAHWLIEDLALSEELKLDLEPEVWM